MIERRTAEREVGVQNLPPLCCVLEQNILLPESTGNTHYPNFEVNSSATI